MAKKTVEQIATALRLNGGFLSYTAQALGLRYQTLQRRILNNKELQKVKEEIDESMLDLTEHMLLKNIKEGKEQSIFFFLRCKGKKRGYVERLEQAVVVEHRSPLVIAGLDLKQIT